MIKFHFIVFILILIANINTQCKDYELFKYDNEKQHLSQTLDLLEKYSPKRDLGTDPHKDIEEWLQFRRGARKHRFPFQREEERGKSSVEIDLSYVIAKTLKNQWDIKIGQQAIERQEGVYQSSKGSFNPIIGADVKNNILYDTQQLGFNTTKDGKAQTVQLFLEKLTRLGTRYSLTGSLERVHDPSLFFTNGFSRTNQYVLSFTIDQPLLRGLKYSPETVEEKVSEIEVSTIKNEYVQTIATEVRDTVFKYWELVAAKEILEIHELSYKILYGLATASERLVEGERLALSALNQQFAELSRASKDLVAAKQDVYRAYNDLLFQMGEEESSFGPNPPNLVLESFPEPESEKSKWDVDLLLSTARQNRGDLIASELRIKEAAWLLKSAKNAVLPSLDLVLGFDVTNNRVSNRSRPFFSSINSGPQKKDLSVMLSFSIPLFNDRAKGEKRQREAELSQAILVESKLDESIRTDIATALRSQLELIDEVYFADKAVQWYETTLKDEIARLKEGYSSLFIVIDYENRLRRTFIEKVLVQKDYADNLTELLFTTGTLVKLDDVTNRVSIDILNYNHLLKKLEL
ncbi:MAG: hypothetical protein K1060chlam2_01047 [Chlamydiae bacterium]|nr:hypothetical protein [Chlamydiota bacterium]